MISPQKFPRTKPFKSPQRIQTLPFESMNTLPIIHSPSSSFAKSNQLKISPVTPKQALPQKKFRFQAPMKTEFQPHFLPNMSLQKVSEGLNESKSSNFPLIILQKSPKSHANLHSNTEESPKEIDSSMNKGNNHVAYLNIEGSSSTFNDQTQQKMLQVSSPRYQSLTISTYKRRDSKRPIQSSTRNFNFSKPVEEYNCGLSAVSDDKSSRRGSILSQSIFL